MQESPGRSLPARLARYLDQRRSAGGDGTPEGRAEFGFACRTHRGNARTLRKFHKVGILQLRPDEVPAEAGLLIPQHVAEAAIVEYQGNDADAVLGCRGQFLDAE